MATDVTTEPPASHSETNLTEPADDDIRSQTSDCVICQTAPVSRVLLPCRHACVCNSCFIQLDRCPMCRSIIRSHFSLVSEDEEAEEDSLEESENTHWLYRLNDRLSAYLGFR